MKQEAYYIEDSQHPDPRETFDSDSPDFDLNKLFSILKSSLPYIIAILLISNLAAYLVVRYTKPLYESSSQLQLDIESQGEVFGFAAPEIEGSARNINSMSEEIELIKSRLFLEKATDVLDLDVSYYTQGNILDDEKFRTSPFKVKYLVKSNEAFGRKFYLKFSSNKNYTLTYNQGEDEQSFEGKLNQTLELPFLSLQVTSDNDSRSSLPNDPHYFIIHSTENQINYLRDNLAVTVLKPEAKTIQLSFSDFNAYKARTIVDGLSNLYLAYTQEEKSQANNKRIQYLNDQIDTTQAKLENYEAYFEDFTINNRSTDLGSDLNKAILLLTEVDSQRTQLRNRLGDLNTLSNRIQEDETYYALSLLSGNDEFITTDIPELVKELNELTGEAEVLEQSQNKNTYAVQLKQTQIKVLKEDILKSLNSLIKETQSELLSLGNRYRELQSTFVQLPAKNTEYGKSRRNYDQLLGFLLTLQEKKIEFEIANAGTTTDFKILSSASMPASPISPNKWIIQAIGMALGLVLSLVFIGARYTLDNKITAVSDIENQTSVPVLGAAPQARKKFETARMIIDNNPKSAFSEALRAVRTNMEFMGARQNNQILSITSTVSGEGKTFVTVNLAGIIALSKKKVVVLDLDMRKPKVHLAFEGENSTHGTSTILIGKHSLEECIRKTSISTLDYIPAGPTPPNPSELVMNSDFDKLLAELKKRYDVILMDTPPVGLVTDGILIMKKADLPIYVFRAGYSHKNYVKNLNRLSTVNKFTNLAAILNGVGKHRGYGAYGYGYGYGGGYYQES